MWCQHERHDWVSIESRRLHTRIGVAAIVMHGIGRAGEIAESLNENKESWLGENGHFLYRDAIVYRLSW